MCKAMRQGAILIQCYQALIIAADDQEYYQDISRSCYDVIFCGVPNFGIRFEELVNIVKDKRSEALIHQLLPDEDTDPSDILSALNRDFARAERLRNDKRLNILCYFKTERTLISEVSKWN